MHARARVCEINLKNLKVSKNFYIYFKNEFLFNSLIKLIKIKNFILFVSKIILKIIIVIMIIITIIIFIRIITIINTITIYTNNYYNKNIYYFIIIIIFFINIIFNIFSTKNLEILKLQKCFSAYIAVTLILIMLNMQPKHHSLFRQLKIVSLNNKNSDYEKICGFIVN